jgi:intracellular sulfur oxidation DsrE/DsrF family protein
MKTLNEIQTQQITDFLTEIENDTKIEILSNIDLNEIDFENAFDSIHEAIEDNNGFDIEIIYYNNAIQYLKENDPSLMESIEIAIDYGYELKNINSELLASLLASQNSRDQFNQYENEINNFFKNI